MPTTVLGFYDLDAAPQHGLTGVLAERLGAVTVEPGFIDGALYVRSDHGAVVIAVQHDSDDEAWSDRPLVAGLIQSAAWRSRAADIRSYRTADAPAAAHIPDEAVFVIQRFDVSAATQDELTSALEAFVARFAQPILGFLDSEILVSRDGARTIWIAPWAHEAALAALETPDSFAAMRGLASRSTQRVFGLYDRVSYVRREAGG